ncbi:unnamed protein product (macronuclear) [Paramecium tetraurelia]|uniref:Uncharacterized protein n=1 Tax=Paramecium tetraurelia TaxID=5888 RepID=A0BIJ8_PARTE|nr:uncharacterized protein GSPATT00004737001 [Paramecium tetraurelia]CAK58365.1 unnamed protein product [Paramecium tetraurelia]|eukprot:XP_001425763.1 hypothetical protein (macronuclear) [Paramecium tetraurelia strain d4-2]
MRRVNPYQIKTFDIDQTIKKKTKYPSNQLMICKKRIDKVKLSFNFTTQQPQNVIDPQINQIIEENQKLKQIIHQLL